MMCGVFSLTVKCVMSVCNSTETPVSDVISLLMHYATFLMRASGDVEAAAHVYAKAMEVCMCVILPCNRFYLGDALRVLFDDR